MDLAGHRILRDGQPLPVKPKAFELLAFLLRHPGQVFTRDQVLEHVWGYDYAGETRTVDVHIHWLRGQIEADPSTPNSCTPSAASATCSAAGRDAPLNRRAWPGRSAIVRGRRVLPRSRGFACRYPARMRISQLFFTTLRDDPADAEMPSHRLLLRAGYVRQLGSGIYSLLPLGWRVTQQDRGRSSARRWTRSAARSC